MKSEPIGPRSDWLSSSAKATTDSSYDAGVRLITEWRDTQYKIRLNVEGGGSLIELFVAQKTLREVVDELKRWVEEIGQ